MPVPTAARGRFLRYDLFTPDPPRARDFYARLFGWRMRDGEVEGIGPCGLFAADGAERGGIAPLDSGVGAPPHWLAYVAAPDVEAACERAVARGGTVAQPATDAPNLGRYAILLDPRRAAIAALSPAGWGPAVGAQPPAEGCFCWADLLTTNPFEAARFYGAVFAWEAVRHDLESGPYWVFRRDGRAVAGMMPLPRETGVSPFWLPSIRVDDADATATLAVMLGATLYVPPRDVPGLGRFAVLGDPTGAAFAVLRSA